tara:strand:+ start:6669 stop:7100 length:432 start_codon:yes stop_codon:yes gene_type:complete
MDPVEKWRQAMKSKDINLLDNILDENVVFYSPVVFTPQKGKEITKLYLSAASGVFSKNKNLEGNVNQTNKDSEFRYIKEVITKNHACLEFESELNGIYINGVDLISWNSEGKITEFKVLIRPLQAVNMLHQMMGKMLDKLKAG